MGPKKRGSADMACASIKDERKQTVTQSGDFDQSETSIELDCEENLTSIRQENNTNALNLIEELNLCYTTSAVTQRIKGLISVKIATLINDLNEKEIQLNNAIESTRKAISLVPNWIELLHFYGNLLYIASNDRKGYEEVIQECSRALSIENPYDPTKGGLEEVDVREASVADVKQNLHSIIQKSNIALISIWMKHLLTESKVGSVPTKQILKDPVGLMSLTKIKKPRKAIEEQLKKEIVSASREWRILQQQSLEQKPISPQSKNNEEENKRVRGRRKKENLKNIGSSVVKKDWVRSYWNSLSLDKKQSLLKVSVHDLETHFKDQLEMEVLSEALSFGKANGRWKFWTCPSCNEKLVDYVSLMQHVQSDHVKVLPPNLRSVFPKIVGDDWVAMIRYGLWYPLDIAGSLRMLERSKDKSESSPDKAMEKESKEEKTGNKKLVETSRNHTEISNVELMVGGSSWWTKVFYLGQKWPLSDDSERTELLEKVPILLYILLKRNYLAASHITKVIRFTMDKIQHIVHGSRFLNIGLEKTSLSLCFLSPSELKKIYRFLKYLLIYCLAGREKDSTLADETHSVTYGSDIKERIIFYGDSLCLLLEKSDSMDDGADSDALLNWILEEYPSSGEQLASWKCLREDKTSCGMEILQKIKEENSILQTWCESLCEKRDLAVAFNTVERLCIGERKGRKEATEFVSQSYEVILKKWIEELVERKNELYVASNVLNEAQHLKVSQFGYEESLTGEDEDWRMQDLMYQADTCIETVILRHKDWFSVEFSKIDANIVHTGTSIWELELKLGSFSAHDYRAIMLPLLKSFLQSHLEEIADKYATEKSEAAKKALLAELALDDKKSINKGGDPSKQTHKSKNKRKNRSNREAKDLKATGGEKARGSIVENVQPELSVVNSKPDSCDPDVHELLRTYSGGSDMVPNSEVESLSINCHEKPHEPCDDPSMGKPDMSKDLLALNDNKSINKGVDHSKQKNKSKNKKKNKGNRKAKNLKVSGGNEEIAEQTHFPVESDDLEPKEEEFRCQLESETDAKTLEETPGYQVKIENEGKQKLQAELHEKASGSIVENVAPELSVVDSKPDSGDPNVQSRTHSGGPDMVLSSEVENPSISFHEKPYEAYEDPSLGKPNFSDDIFSVPIQSAGGTALPSKSSTNSGGQGLPNEGTSEVLLTRQCRWKRRQGKPQYSSTKSLEALSSEKDKFQARQSLPNEVVVNSTTGKNVIGTGLKNKVGENNCFLNVIIQSLWNLTRFKIEFWGRSISWHNTIGNPCVICALYDIFDALSESEIETQSEAVDPTCLRVALSKFYPNSDFFQEAQMNDASEVLAAIFDCLHKSFTFGSRKLNAELEETNCIGSWVCRSNACVAHSLFGMNIFQRMNCNSCGLESRCQKYTSLSHNVNASSLQTMKIMSADSSFDELLKLVAIDRQLACDPEVGGCGKLNYIHHILSKPPQVFTTVLGWQSVHESENIISATLAILTTELDIGVVYRGLDPGNKRYLVSVVCYCGRHYVCFIYNHGNERWFLYDDQTVKVTGSWNDVLTMCKSGHLQPQILFFEALD